MNLSRSAEKLCKPLNPVKIKTESEILLWLKEKSKLRELIEEYGIKDLKDVHEFVKALTAETIQEILEGEFENELGYSKYDYKNKQTGNSRNGHSKKPYKVTREKLS